MFVLYAFYINTILRRTIQARFEIYEYVRVPRYRIRIFLRFNRIRKSNGTAKLISKCTPYLKVIMSNNNVINDDQKPGVPGP